MVFVSMYAVVIYLLVSPTTVSALSQLSLGISGPPFVDGIDKLRLTTTLTNTGDETLRVVNDPRSPLSNIPTDTFNIQNAEGAKPEFIGIITKYSPEYGIKHGDYIILAPGQSTAIEHDLFEGYNFTSSGPGAYTIEASNLFYLADSTNKLTPTYALTNVYATHISGSLVVVRPVPFVKRSTFNNCGSTEQDIVNVSITAAQTYVSNALDYLQSHNSSTTRYKTWFGEYTAARHSTLVSSFSKIKTSNFSSYTYDCSCLDNRYAWVTPSQTGVIHLCNAFFEAHTTGTDSRAGALVHEASHFTAFAGTVDWASGQEFCKELATDDPDYAINNADNYQYFAENNPTLA
ncbi:deuterolysin M35 metalloprotease [Pluteus cervinus]|uniref:Deuterolysin M35 metalloprotease n=1 Tax=Pluteus cervinus TaxID=181527 RepID=A0ACD3BAW0_9AGAR|nr:deuterolysin M35 metalloprotease [Pluteus cervinus]